jgi:hypothetical protein
MQINSRMKLVAGILALIAFVAIVSGPSTVSAQDVAVGQATATLLTALTVSATQALNFGNVLQGVPKTMGKDDDDSSGIFTISGEGGKQISLYMQLPDYLSTSSGDDRMVISFSSTDATLDTTSAGSPATPGGGAVTGQDPHNLPLINIGATDGVCKVYLGGTVIPSVDQKAGAYSADIILTVAYTGS